MVLISLAHSLRFPPKQHSNDLLFSLPETLVRKVSLQLPPIPHHASHERPAHMPLVLTWKFLAVFICFHWFCNMFATCFYMLITLRTEPSVMSVLLEDSWSTWIKSIGCTRLGVGHLASKWGLGPTSICMKSSSRPVFQSTVETCWPRMKRIGPLFGDGG